MNAASRGQARRLPGAALACLGPILLAGCAFHLPPKPEIYKAHVQEFTFGDRHLHLHCVTPVKPRSPQVLILFETGDAGWLGTSHKVFEHLASLGYYMTAYSSRELLKHIKKSGRPVTIENAAAAVEDLVVGSRRILGLPGTTPVIVTGFSRGANLVVFAAGMKRLHPHLAGGIAIALTRETDFLETPDPSRLSSFVQVDEKGRLQTYPAIALAAPLPFAVIQSNGDKYVPAEEARRLFGPDTDIRRLYQVDARNHSFSGGQEELMRDLDDAVDWIEGQAKTRQPAESRVPGPGVESSHAECPPAGRAR